MISFDIFWHNFLQLNSSLSKRVLIFTYLEFPYFMVIKSCYRFELYFHCHFFNHFIGSHGHFDYFKS